MTSTRACRPVGGRRAGQFCGSRCQAAPHWLGRSAGPRRRRHTAHAAGRKRGLATDRRAAEQRRPGRAATVNRWARIGYTQLFQQPHVYRGKVITVRGTVKYASRVAGRYDRGGTKRANGDSTSREGQPSMAPPNKCLARCNKSRTCSTEHMNGDPADKGNRAQQQGEA